MLFFVDITVVITDEERRFGVKKFVNGWLSLTYMIPTVPLDSTLHLGIRTNAQSGAPVRVVLDQISTEPITIFEGTATHDWLDLTEPMGNYAEQTIMLKLETAVAPGGTVYWGIPRFVIGE